VSHPLVGLLDLLRADPLDHRGDAVLGAEVQHLLDLADAAGRDRAEGPVRPHGPSVPPGSAVAGVVRRPAGHSPGMDDDWRALLEDLPLEQRLKAIAVYELASDRAEGQSFESASATLRAAATAEGLDDGHPWIQAAAAHISAPRGPRP